MIERKRSSNTPKHRGLGKHKLWKSLQLKEVWDRHFINHRTYHSRLNASVKKMMQCFTSHPHSVNESYFVHLCRSLLLSAMSLMAGVYLLLHAIFPFLFTNCGSKIIAKIAKHLPAQHNDTDTM